jgi:TfoX/Sxy family transcriptional regulator of competence genes
MAYDEKTAERVRKLLSGRRDVVAKKMMGGRGGLLVRVGEAYDEALREPHAAAVEMRGRVMGGFVRVAPEGYRTEAALKKWVERGVTAAAARPPKAERGKTKRAAKKKP